MARGWSAHVLGEAAGFPSAAAAVEHFRAQEPGISDQVLPAFTVRKPDGGPVAAIEDGDGVIFFNFRGDRAMEMSRALTAGAGFDRFDRGRVPDVSFAGMMLYDGDLGIPEHYLVEPPEIRSTLGEYLAASGVSQFACAETQKFGHVTYFWNGNRSGKFDDALEEYVEIGSDKVPFEQRPWMRSAETADAVNRAVAEGRCRFIRANFAGGDMVGHTGNLEATVIALEAIDLAIGRILAAVAAANGCLVVTADHGNAEDMVERDKAGAPLYEDGKPVFRTAHSINPRAVRDPGLLRAQLPARPAPRRRPRQPRRHPAGAPGLCSPRGVRPEPAASDRYAPVVPVGRISRRRNPTPHRAGVGLRFANPTYGGW